MMLADPAIWRAITAWAASIQARARAAGWSRAELTFYPDGRVTIAAFDQRGFAAKTWHADTAPGSPLPSIEDVIATWPKEPGEDEGR